MKGWQHAMETLGRGIFSSSANDYSTMSTMSIMSIRTSIQIGIEFPGQ